MLLAFISFSFTGTEAHKLIPGKGIDDDIIIGKTAREEVIKKFGNDFIEQLRYAKIMDSHDSIFTTYILSYKKEGVEFDIDKNLGLHLVTINGSFNGKTEKGIHAGISTMQDVINAYGKVEWRFGGKRMWLAYDSIGISFYTSFNGVFPVPKTVKENALKEKINKIEIQRPFN